MSISERLYDVTARIDSACRSHGKDPASIALLAVSKTFPAAAVQEGLDAGLHAFGENYVQEGVEKILALQGQRAAITWHFIGPLQSNKTREVAEHFDWMHSIDREKIARRLSEQRPAAMAPLQVCIQVNVSGEDSKSGVAPTEAHTLALAISGLPRLQLRGVMAIPEPTDDPALQRQRFAQLVSVFSAIKPALPEAARPHFDTLSMGMSSDMESAIAESLPGTITMVRVGTALFGQRAPR